ncbi:MAG: HupE/UreJ family protein [Acidobacteria bacterium]|nr:HupE/UreJ family protein [Acidobacteriota bacterium]
MIPRALALIILLAACAEGHVISMSNGDLRVSANRGIYELRMPLYEIQHVTGPEKALFENIRFSSRGVAGRIAEKKCGEDQKDASFRCTVIYEWPEPVEELEVVCTFHSVTVPNHVHLLRAYRDDKTDQAVFDFSQTKAQVRFRPPTAFELFVVGWGSGFARAFSSGAAVLFLGCLALAARSRRELVLITAMFLAGEVLSALIVPRTPWNPQPRFVEAALALTVAYLAVEILTLPQAGQRWAVSFVLGGFHGLSYALYLTSTGYDALAVLSGMAIAEILAVLIFALLLSRGAKIFSAIAPVAHRVASFCLLIVGLAWFAWRLRS